MVVSLPLSEQNLIITGYTGPNQPLLGRQVAQQLGMPMINIESLIAERTGLTVDEIRKNYGESRLKTVETQILQETYLRRQTVIRISARTLLVGDTLKRLRETGPIICLVTTLDAILQRLHTSMGARYYDPNERALELGQLKQEWGVRGLKDVIELDTTYLDREDTIEYIVRIWQEIAIIRG